MRLIDEAIEIDETDCEVGVGVEPIAVGYVSRWTVAVCTA